MSNDDKPLSTLVAQGWEIVGFTGTSETEGSVQSILLRKLKAHKILRIRPKTFGKGYVVKEMDV